MSEREGKSLADIDAEEYEVLDSDSVQNAVSSEKKKKSKYMAKISGGKKMPTSTDMDSDESGDSNDEGADGDVLTRRVMDKIDALTESAQPESHEHGAYRSESGGRVVSVFTARVEYTADQALAAKTAEMSRALFEKTVQLDSERKAMATNLVNSFTELLKVIKETSDAFSDCTIDDVGTDYQFEMKDLSSKAEKLVKDFSANLMHLRLAAKRSAEKALAKLDKCRETSDRVTVVCPDFAQYLKKRDRIVKYHPEPTLVDLQAMAQQCRDYVDKWITRHPKEGEEALDQASLDALSKHNYFQHVVRCLEAHKDSVDRYVESGFITREEIDSFKTSDGRCFSDMTKEIMTIDKFRKPRGRVFAVLYEVLRPPKVSPAGASELGVRAKVDGTAAALVRSASVWDERFRMLGLFNTRNRVRWTKIGVVDVCGGPDCAMIVSWTRSQVVWAAGRDICMADASGIIGIKGDGSPLAPVSKRLTVLRGQDAVITALCLGRYGRKVEAESMLVVGLQNGGICIVSPETDEVLNGMPAVEGAIQMLRITYGGQSLLGYGADEGVLWSLKFNRVTKIKGGGLVDAAFSCDGTALALVYGDGMTVYELAAGHLTKKWKHDPQTGIVKGCRFPLGGSMIITLGEDETITSYNAADGEEPKEIAPGHLLADAAHLSNPGMLEISHSHLGTVVEGVVRIWSLRPIVEQTMEVVPFGRSLSFSSDGQTCAVYGRGRVVFFRLFK